MAYYLFQIAYTPEAWAAQLKNPRDVSERTRGTLENLGGRLVGNWYAFGEYDLVSICEFPDNVSAASIALTVSAGGAAKAIKTTPLMTIEEGLEAMRRAGGADYQPPSE